MEPFLAALSQHGVYGIVIAGLVYWVRETQAKLADETKGRLADAVRFKDESVALLGRVHAREVAVDRTTEAMEAALAKLNSSPPTARSR